MPWDGVYLQITGNNGRSWVFRFERDYGGKRRGRHIGLGPCCPGQFGGGAREGLGVQEILLKGIDPLDHKNALRQQALAAATKSVTFRECADRYWQRRRLGGATPCIGSSGGPRWRRTFIQ